MYNDFVIIGPAEDPAKIKGAASAAEALARIAASQSRFVSRGDKSGTHSLELALWQKAGIEPKGALVHRVRAGHGRDPGHRQRPPRLHHHRSRHLPRVPEAGRPPILVENDRPLLNIYSVMEVNPANGPRVNAAGGKAFADFMLAPETQAIIKAFGVDKYGQPLFVPDRRQEGRGSVTSGLPPEPSPLAVSIIADGRLEALRLLVTGDPEVWRITALSLAVSGSATLLSLVLGIPLGTALALARFPRPAVADQPRQHRHGSAAGRRRALRDDPALAKRRLSASCELLYTPGAMVLAQLVIAAPS